jgi:hypothetical protein
MLREPSRWADRLCHWTFRGPNPAKHPKVCTHPLKSPPLLYAASENNYLHLKLSFSASVAER